MRVAVHYGRDVQSADETTEALGHACAGVYRFEFAPGADPRELWRAVIADGPIDALVNNAGVYAPMRFLAPDDGAFDAALASTMAVNFTVPALLTRAACLYFEKRGGGKVVNVASRVGHRGEAGASAYAASKAALINLTRSLAVELTPKNIQVYAVAPGWVETAMARKDMDRRLPEILAGIPLGRLASVDDCAGAVSFLLSSDAAYLSGVTIDVNGASYFH
jgi:3-oxoacyl-[acyl-carrier protein] reductase